jgi:toxin ParE1/3/4
LANRGSYSVERTAQADRDLDVLFDFLLASYMHFGDGVDDAFERVGARIERVKSDLRSLGKGPHQGTLHPSLMPNLRSVTKDRATFYFAVDDDAQIVRVLAVFFGGQDHQRDMLKRLLSE